MAFDDKKLQVDTYV